jgi:hypothetical protein
MRATTNPQWWVMHLKQAVDSHQAWNFCKIWIHGCGKDEKVLVVKVTAAEVQVIVFRRYNSSKTTLEQCELENTIV